MKINQIILGFLLLFFSTFGSCFGQSWNVQVGDSLWIANGAHASVFCLYKYDSLLYVGGGFEYADTFLVNMMANWNGASWSPLGQGVTAIAGGAPRTFIYFDDNIYMGGGFQEIDNLDSTRNLAMWDGSSWHRVGTSGMLNSDVRSSVVYDNKLFIGGNFTKIGPIWYVGLAAWDGSTWINVGNTDNNVYAMAIFNDELYIGGNSIRLLVSPPPL